MLSIDHVGYAVKRLNSAIIQLTKIGYQFGDIVEDTDRNIHIAFGDKDGYRIELVSPIEKGSPVEKILDNVGPMPYHICYESDAFEEDTNNMILGGYRLVTEPAPAIAFNRRRIVFLYSLSLGLIEIVEK